MVDDEINGALSKGVIQGDTLSTADTQAGRQQGMQRKEEGRQAGHPQNFSPVASLAVTVSMLHLPRTGPHRPSRA